MEIDLAQLDSSSAENLLRAQICVIGAGIAGLTLAHRLIALGHDVLVLEAGGRTPDAERVSPGEILQRGRPHPGSLEQRVSALGGTSLTWGGQLLEMPSGEGWTISAEEKSRYNAMAEQIFTVDDLPYDAARFFRRMQEPVPVLLKELQGISPALSKFAPFSRRNLARTLGETVRAHPVARVLLHARVEELLPAAERDRIEAVLVRSPAGRMYRIEASQFVVAAGTIESVRLLLASRSGAAEGVGNRHDQVGRNFHDHLTITAATLRLRARDRVLSALGPRVARGTVHSVKLMASPELCSRQQLMPVMAHLVIDEPESSGAAALRTLLRGRQQGHLAASLREALPHLPRALRDAVRLAWSARMHHRRYISPQARVMLRFNAAQQTPSFSRITLAPEPDRFGAAKVVLDWRIHPDEVTTLRAFAAHLRGQFDRIAPASFEWNAALFPAAADEPLPGLDDARHAMGGACMGVNPRTSVVTPDLRVHGLDNLFVASAAVFPDGSAQLPTLPLMALTLRLADHLHRR